MINGTFHTSDLALAAYLKIKGYSIRATTHDNDGKGTFQFQDSAERPDDVLGFFNRQAEVEPLAYLDQFKSLKAMLKQKLKG